MRVVTGSSHLGALWVLLVTVAYDMTMVANNHAALAWYSLLSQPAVARDD